MKLSSAGTIELPKYSGKAKTVQCLPKGKVKLIFKDEISAFNGRKHAHLEGKGKLAANISKLLFDKLGEFEILHHYESMHDPQSLICARVNMIPLEVVVRLKAWGSVVKRRGVREGTVFQQPLVEFFQKDDSKDDPIISSDRVIKLDILTRKERDDLTIMARRCSQILQFVFAGIGIDLIDIKYEFGRLTNKLVLADELSPDNCRLHDLRSAEVFDKDLFRFDQGDILKAYEIVNKRLSHI